VEKKKNAPPISINARTFNVFVDDECIEVQVDPVNTTPANHPQTREQPCMGETSAPAVPCLSAHGACKAFKTLVAASSGTPLKAPMPGIIVRYEKKVDDVVCTGDAIVILEAMKMENVLTAPCDGTITAVHFKSGDSVAKDEVLCDIESK